MHKTIALAAFMAGAVVAPLFAEEAPRSTLVLDASGSMWGQIDGVAKITIARDVMRDLLGALPETQQLGLMVYGHRRKGDCSDIEEVIAPAPGSHGAIVSALDGISPKGKTPLSAAVLQAAEGLRATEEKATVILISDGKETCGLDPCAIGAQLEQTGVDFTLHAIGFGVADEATRAQLQCLAENTGGSYRDASNAAALASALGSVAAAKPAEAPDLPEASLEVPRKAQAGSLVEVAWEGPAEEGDWIGTLAPDAEVGAFSSRIGIDHGNPAPMPAPSKDGRYEVVYVQAASGKVLARQPIEIAPMVASVTAQAEGQTGGKVVVNWQGRGSPKDFIGIAPVADGFPATTFYFETMGPQSQALQMPSQPGAYEIVYIATTDPWEVLARTPISLTDPDLSLKAAPKVARGGEITALWSGTPPNPDNYIALAKRGDALPHVVDYAHTHSHLVRLQAPDQPGEYELRYFYAEGDRIVTSLPIMVE